MNVLILSDFVGCGDVAMAASRAVLTGLGYNALCLPTALISHIWSLGRPAQLDTTGYLREALTAWERVGIRFDAVLVGYLDSEAQAAFLGECCAKWREAGTKIFLDPVFGDDGKLYRGITGERLEFLRGILKYTDYVLPNATEAAFLTGRADAADAAQALVAMGAGTAIVTGAEGKEVVLADQAGTQCIPYTPVPGSFSGAGDAFTALFAGGILVGSSPAQSVAHAAATVGEWLTRCRREPGTMGLPIDRLWRETK